MRKYSKTTIFNKVLKIMSGITGGYFRKTNEINKFTKKYDFMDHFKSMIYLQISGADGLRDLVVKNQSHPKLKKDFKIPSYSQLSRLNKNKNIDVFKEIFLKVLELGQKEFKDMKISKELKDIKIIDSTMITLGIKFAPDLAFSKTKSAIRVSTLISDITQLPEKITIVPAKVGERNCIKDYLTDPNSIYLFDRGYCKYSWYDEMFLNKIRFVTRQTKNAITEEYLSDWTGKENLYDSLITLGANSSKNKTKFKYREILYFENDEDKEYRLITNIFDLPAQDIISLYKVRWKIESFFKWTKQHLTIKHWIGYSINAITTQIYCALIVYILLLILKKRLNSTLSLFDILRKIRVVLTETSALKNILSG